jgi:hypothetical protein
MSSYGPFVLLSDKGSALSRIYVFYRIQLVANQIPLSSFMLKSQVDEDEFCKRTTDSSLDDPRTRFYAQLRQLLATPEPYTLEALLLSNNSDVVSGLKHLIKFKFLQLQDDVRKNIVKIVELMLGYDRNIDTLVVNLLRIGMGDEVYGLYSRNPRYFQDNPTSLLFLAFSCAHSERMWHLVDSLDFYARDLLFMRIFKRIGSGVESSRGTRTRDNAVVASNFCFPYASEFTQKQLKMLFTPTQPNLLSSRLSVDLELNLLFMAEMEENFNFYADLLLSEYIRSEEEACAAVRFLANIPTPLCIYRTVNAILGKYPSAFTALIFDLLFYNQSEAINQNVAEYLRREGMEKLEKLKGSWAPLAAALSRIRQEPLQTPVEIAQSIHSLNFSRFYGLVKEMRMRGKAFIPRSLYGQVIRESAEWDGYAQVYLWKILAHQKILFGYEVKEEEARSIEAQEGMEVIAHLR